MSFFGGKMSKKISVRMYLDGATQFNSDIRKIDDNLRMLNSEMKQNAETFKTSQNSIDALRAKSETLNKQYETAEKKVKSYSDRLLEVSKAHDKASQDYQNYNTQLQKEQEELVKIEKQYGRTSEEYAKQSEKVKELETVVSQTSDVMEKLDSQEVKLQTSLNNATAEQVKYGRELVQTNAYLEEAENSTDKCAVSIDEYGRNVSEADRKVSELQEELDRLMKNEAMEKLSEGAKKFLESMLECAEVAETFEYSIAKVQSIARVSDEDLACMSSEIRRVGVEMGYSAGEISEAVYQAISASVDASEAVGFVEDATKLARAGFTETTTAVDVLTTAINAYGKEANTTAHIADDLITTQNLGKTTVDELAGSIGTIIPTAAAYGVSLDQLSTAYTLLTKQGINTAYSTTYLRSMLNELGNSASAVSDILYDETGHSFGELTKMGYTLGDIMKVLGDYVNGDSESFANLFGNIRAGQGALALYNTGAEAFNDTLKIMGENAGATEEAFATMSDTAVMTNERFEASVENLKISIGEGLSPTIENLKKMGISWIETITGIAEENPTLVQALTGAAVGIAAVATAATAAAGAIALMKAAYGDLSGVIAVAGSAALIGAFAGVQMAAEDATEEIIKNCEALEQNQKESDSLVTSHAENTARIKDLAERYKELAGMVGITDEALEEQNSIATELNMTVPGMALSYRESKYAVEEFTDAVQQNIDTLIAEWEQENNMDDLKQRYKDRADAERELEEATKALNEATQLQAEYQEQLNNGMEEVDFFAISNAYDEVTARIGELTTAQETAQKALETADEKYKEQEQLVREDTEKIQENVDSKRAAEEAEKALKDALAAASEAIGKQIGLFDEWNGKSKITFDQMLKNWQDQTTGVNQYSDDILYLKNVTESDVDPALKNLAQTFADLDVNHSGEIHVLVEELKNMGDISDKSNEKVKKLTDTWQERIDTISKAEGVYTSIQLDEQDYVDGSTKLFTQFYKDSEADRETFNKDMTELSVKGVEDQAQAVEDNIYLVEDASQQLMENSLAKARESIDMPSTGGTSGKYRSLGQDIVSSIVEGFDGGDSTIGDALGNILQNAANSVNVSGIADRINAQLGAELARMGNR